MKKSWNRCPVILAVVVASLTFFMFSFIPVFAEIIPGSETILVATDGAAKDYFGNAISVSGSTMVVGSYHVENEAQGAVYVFEHDGSAWVQQAKLVAQDGVPGNQFGYSVSISGDMIAVGAPGVNESTGAVYIFKRTNGAWLQISKLDNPSGTLKEYYGWYVYLANDTLLASAPNGFSKMGGIYTYEYIGNSWDRKGDIVASNGTAGDWFGGNISASGNTLAVSAENTNKFRGSVYIFTRSGNTWTERAVITPNEEIAGDASFGISISLDGNTLLVGANFYDYNNIPNSGAAYVFVGSGSTWVQQARLVSKTPANSELFGSSVRLLGDSAIIGTPGSDQGAGTVMLFERNGSAWTQTQEISASDPKANAYFGDSLWFSDDEIMVGTRGRQSYQGAVYLFDHTQPSPTTTTTTPQTSTTTSPQTTTTTTPQTTTITSPQTTTTTLPQTTSATTPPTTTTTPPQTSATTSPQTSTTITPPTTTTPTAKGGLSGWVIFALIASGVLVLVLAGILVVRRFKR